MNQFTSVDDMVAQDVFHERYYSRPLPDTPKGYPNGWMSPNDLALLYNAAYLSTGHVLEVGPWLGRSTTALAMGLRDRQADGAKPVSFDTIDFGITSAGEWKEKFGEELDLGKQNGRVADAVYHPGGTVALCVQLYPWRFHRLPDCPQVQPDFLRHDS